MRDARDAGGMDEKKKTGSIGVSVSRVGLARAETRGTTRLVGWWMDELSTTGRDGTGRGEDAKTRTTD